MLFTRKLMLRRLYTCSFIFCGYAQCPFSKCSHNNILMDVDHGRFSANFIWNVHMWFCITRSPIRATPKCSHWNKKGTVSSRRAPFRLWTLRISPQILVTWSLWEPALLLAVETASPKQLSPDKTVCLCVIFCAAV